MPVVDPPTHHKLVKRNSHPDADVCRLTIIHSRGLFREIICAMQRAVSVILMRGILSRVPTCDLWRDYIMQLL